MKTANRKPAPSKLVAKFDNQLMQIIMEDLKTFRANTTAIRKATEQQLLAA